MAALFLANLAMSSYFLALCYLLVTVVTVNKYIEVRRVLQQHHQNGWSTVQLLILSVALGCLFRTATFSTLCIFDSQHAEDVMQPGGAGLRRNAQYGQPRDLDFYNKVVAVLFNLPDFLFVSSYLLLVLVWAESFQSVRHGLSLVCSDLRCSDTDRCALLQSRRHWFSAEDFRRRWMIFYLIFNGALYLTQLVLYASLFLYDENGIYSDETHNRLSLVRPIVLGLEWTRTALRLTTSCRSPK